MSDLVAFLDTQFNFVRVNRACAEADGREPSFFTGKNHFDLYPNPENQEIFKGVVETGKSYFSYAKPFEYALGVGIMRERARVIGAHFTIDSQRDRGTEITVTWDDTKLDQGWKTNDESPTADHQ